MSRMWHVVGAVALGFLAAHEAAATIMETALADAAWDEPTVALEAENETDSAVELAGELYVTDTDAILACGACEAGDCDDSSCEDCCCGVDCGTGVGYCCPRWYATIGTVVLQREDPSVGTISAANPALTPFFTAQAFDFDFEAGAEVALARRFNNGTILEGRYFGVDNTATQAIVTPGNFIGPGFTGPGGTAISGRYLTMLDSTEFNARKQVTDRLTLLSGFRWIELRDEAHFRIGPTARANYDYDNKLYGGQFGGNLLLSRQGSRLLANIESKAGVFGNTVHGGIIEYAPGPIGGFLGNDTTTSFVGEINLTGGYRLSDHVVLRTGYQLLWIENVALASDAASRSLTNPSLLLTVSDDAGLFYHGATGGIDIVW